MTLAEELKKRLEVYRERKIDLESQLKAVDNKIVEFEGAVNKIES